MSNKFSQNHALKGRGSGFSLIELLVVIAIIGLLSSIVLASLSSARARGRDGRRIADIAQLRLALELFYDANQTYPTALSLLVAPGYIPAIPVDPGTGHAYAYVGLKGAATTATICASYHLGAKLEINTAGTQGSVFLDDKDGSPNGTYGTLVQDGPNCSGTTQTPSTSDWAGSTEIPQVVITGGTHDFEGANDSTNLVYDMRP